MPTIPQQALQTVRSGNLNPSLLSGGSGGASIRGASINSRVNVQPVKTTFIPEKDMIGPVVAHVGQQLGNAAYILAEKDAEMEAQEAALAYENLASGRWLGAGDPNSDNYSPGYASTKTKVAVKGLDVYQQSLVEYRANISSGLGDMARAKFLAKSQHTFTAYRNQGASHALNSRVAWDKELKAASQQSAISQLDDKLAVNDLQGVQALVIDYARTTANLPEKTADGEPYIPTQAEVATMAAAAQNFHKSAIEYVGSTEGASNKLLQYQNQFENSFDVTTATAMNKKIITVADRELRQQDMQLSREYRQEQKAQRENNLMLFSSVDKGVPVDWEHQRRLVEAGQLSSTVYISQKSRAETQAYLPAVPPEVERYAKKQLLESPEDTNEILANLTMFDNASQRRLGNFSITIQDKNKRDKISYAHSRLEKSITNANLALSGSDLQQTISQAQRDAERIIIKQPELSQHEVLNRVLPNYTQGYKAPVSPMISIPQGDTINLPQTTKGQAIRILLDAEAMGAFDGYSSEEIDTMYQQINSYYEYNPKRPEAN